MPAPTITPDRLASLGYRVCCGVAWHVSHRRCGYCGTPFAAPPIGRAATTDGCPAAGPVNMDGTRRNSGTVAIRPRKGPTKTEARYLAECLSSLPPDWTAIYEGVSFLLSNGHRYTPDYAVRDSAGNLSECHEVKGSYRLHSHSRARLAYDCARQEWPGIKWVWAEWDGGAWRADA